MASQVNDVAIVGYGPVGALLARQLGMRGFTVAVLEREDGPYPLPRAVHFDGEVMRVFQNAGLAEAVGAISRPGRKGMHFVNAAGRTLMIRQVQDGLGPQGWHTSYYFNQPDLEAVLRSAAEGCAGVRARHSAEVTAIEQSGGHAVLTVHDRSSGATDEIRARYVVGCDGANSRVRSLLGSGAENLGLQERWLVCDFLLHRPLSAYPHLTDYSIQHCDPARPMTECYVTGRRRRWEMMLRPEESAEEVSRPERVWQMLSQALTPDDATLERTAVYTFRSLIADGWRKGRILIAGDAAHQTPPFLGQGMCAGMRDCANLAWKLERVLRGESHDSLLDTYESERRPHVHAFIDLAVKVGAIIQADGAAAEERDRQFAAGGPQLFNFPQPQLGPGVHIGPAPAGVIGPQPLIEGVRLDDLTGGRFAVIAGDEAATQVSEATRHLWSAMRLARVHHEALGEWLEAQGARSAILRPDGYVFGLASDAKSLGELSERLREACRPTAS